MKNTKETERAEIMFLDKLLPRVSEDAEKYIADPFGFSCCFGKYGKRAEKNNTYWCTDCGAEFSLDEIKDYRKNPECVKTPYYGYSTRWTHLGTCPHCGRPLKIDNYRYKKHTFEDEVAVNATMGEWKIERYFVLKSYCKPGHKTQLVIEDIGASWTKGKNTYHYIARLGGMFYSKYWKSDTRHFSESGVGGEKSDAICDHYLMPDFSLESELTKRGIDTDNLHGMKLTQILNYMNDSPAFETLWKQGDWAVAKFFKRSLYEYWSSIKVARRHGFVLNEDNLVEWQDLVRLLRYFGKDTKNPKFICPADLHQAHQDALAEMNRRNEIAQERRRREMDEWNRRHAEELMKKAKETEEAFIKRRKKYFDLSIAGDGFTIVCLKSIDEFKHEGDTLKHCVFRCGYYDKADSLILSARDADNNPIETLEIDLRSFRIWQCYGYDDSFTDRHNDIVKTMEDNMWRVKEIRNGKVAIAC